MKPATIIWEDIMDIKPGQWIEYDDVLDHPYLNDTKKFTAETRGYVIEETEDYVLICTTRFLDNSEVSNITRIPRGCVKSIKYE